MGIHDLVYREDHLHDPAVPDAIFAAIGNKHSFLYTPPVFLAKISTCQNIQQETLRQLKFPSHKRTVRQSNAKVR